MLMDSLELNSTIQWRQFDFKNDSIILEQGILSSDILLSSGIGIGQVNQVFYAGSGISGIKQYDLHNLKKSVFGHELNINLSGGKVKVFCLKNNSNSNLFFISTGQAGFTDMFGWGYLGQFIKPSGNILYYDLNQGYLVDSGSRYFYLSGIADYELGMFLVNSG